MNISTILKDLVPISNPSDISKPLLVGVKKITPAEASYILENLNTTNRAPTANNINRIAEQISKGLWMVNGETIIFSDKGLLLDGQHRLHACVDSKKDIFSLVVAGIPTYSFPTLNSGKKRGASDIVSVSGILNNDKDRRTYSKPISAAIKVFADIAPNYLSLLPEETRHLFFTGSRKTLSNDVVLEISIKFPEFTQIAKEHSKYLRNRLKPGGSGIVHPSLRQAMAFLFGLVDKAGASNFWEQVERGASNHVPDVGPLLLREKFLARGTAPLTKEDHILIIKAWNSYRSRTNLKMLKVTPTEDYPPTIF